MSAQGSVYSWCGCRDPVAGGRLGSRCPQRGQRGHGSWYLSLELPAGSDGHRRRIRRGGFPTLKAAVKALARLRMPADPAGLVTTGDWLDRWLGERTGPRESTVRGYAAHVRLYLQPCLGPILVSWCPLVPVSIPGQGGAQSFLEQGEVVVLTCSRRDPVQPGDDPGGVTPAEVLADMAKRSPDYLAGVVVIGVYCRADRVPGHCREDLGVQAGIIGVACGQGGQLRGGCRVPFAGGGEQRSCGVSGVRLAVVVLFDEFQQYVHRGRPAFRVVLGGGLPEVLAR